VFSTQLRAQRTVKLSQAQLLMQLHVPRKRNRGQGPSLHAAAPKLLSLLCSVVHASLVMSMQVSMTLVVRPIALILLFAPLCSMAAPSCSSSIEGDSTTVGCFGWCGAAFASEHCAWCKCRGCPFCAQNSGAVSAGVTPALIVSAGTTATLAAACKSTVAGDSDAPDCQPFCSADFASDHCELCKCRACGFCGCTSEAADDVSVAQCQGWCSAEYADVHCQQCKCRDCQFCKHGSVCTPAAPGDAEVELCDTFCDAEYASSHCGLCKCKHCGFCKAAASAAASVGDDTTTVGSSPIVGGGAAVGGVAAGGASRACHSDAPIGVWDSDVEKCEPFCSASEADSHCKLCKCRACDLCHCHSPFADDSIDEECEPWCSIAQWTSHCQHCKCKACNFCREGVPCDKKGPDDSEIEKCESFCNKMFTSTHCTMCKCKGCAFCRGKVIYPPMPPSPPRPPKPPPKPLNLPAPPPDRGGAHGSPEPARFLTAPSTTCASVGLTWTAPFDKGSPIDRYEVLYKGPSDLAPISFFSLSKKPQAEVTGLAPATTYQFRVRAHNGVGFGMLSTSVTATTAAPLRPPADPMISASVIASGAGGAACDVLQLAMPALRPGCSGDEFLGLQWREARWATMGAEEDVSGKGHTSGPSSASAGWVEWKADDGSNRVPSDGPVILNGLSVSSAYQVRVLAYNSLGAASKASPPSPPFALGLSTEAMLLPPVVRGVSSSIVDVSWRGAASDCRPLQSWEVLVNRPLGDDPQGWTTVRRGIVGSSVRLPSSRCPHGCRFRVHAEGIAGWTIYSSASSVVTTPAEPSTPPLACRVELATSLRADLVDAWLNGIVEQQQQQQQQQQDDEGASFPFDASAAVAASTAVVAAAMTTGRELALGVALALGVDSSRVQLVSTYVAPSPTASAESDMTPVQFVLLDLLPCVSCGDNEFGDLGSSNRNGRGSPALRTANELAAHLAQLISGKSRELFARSSTQGILPSAGLVQVLADGSATALWSTDSGKEEDKALLSEARMITLALVSLAGLLGFCVTTASSMSRMRQASGGYGLVEVN